MQSVEVTTGTDLTFIGGGRGEDKPTWCYICIATTYLSVEGHVGGGVGGLATGLFWVILFDPPFERGEEHGCVFNAFLHVLGHG